MRAAVPAQPAVGVGAIVFDSKGRVLLVRRGHPPKAGLWSVPGGRLEPGESLVECCRREVLEETGLEIEPGPIVAVADREAEGYRYVIVDFAAGLKGRTASEPAAASDVSDARWVEPADVAGYSLVEGLAAAIAAARMSLDAGGTLGLAPAEDAGSLYLPKVPVPD